MTSRERLRAAINHTTPDRVPIDFGSTSVSGMHAICVEALRKRLGLPERPVRMHHTYGGLGMLDDDLLEALGVDAAGIFPRSFSFGYANENWKEFRTPWGQVVLVGEKFAITTDTNGDLLTYPQGDVTAPPSGRMPVGGYYFDAIIRQEPIDEEALDPEDNMEEFGPMAEADLRYLKEQVDRVAASGRGLVGSVGGMSIGDIAQVPAPFLKRPKGIRDITEWYVSLATRQEYVMAVFERQTEVALGRLAQAHAILGDALDVLYICGTDFGTQTSQFCSAETFRKLWAPHYRRLNDWVHAHTSWKTFKHSCGAVEPFLDDFIEVGFDILNPVQCSAAGMDPKRLKQRYGDRLVFWGGGVNTQRTLPFGTPEEVRAEVLERCETFAPGGGFVFNAIHNVQAGTPVENILAMFDAIREFNGER
jgi:uroporphyrinogen-III decarboxylase